MSLVLAIEPDAKQASILKRVVRERARAEVTVVDSKDAAIAAISAHPPDLILVTALLSPRDEEDLVAHLRTLGDESDHLQTITIPLLAPALGGDDEDGFFKKKFGKRRRDTSNSVGCDPWTFAEQVAGYLKGATEARVARQAQLEYAQRHRLTPADTPATTEAPAAPESIFVRAEDAAATPVTREPIFVEPEPVVATAPEPAYVEPEPVYVQPEPVHAAEEPIYVAPEAIVIPEPTAAVDSVVLPEPTMHEPIARQPEAAPIAAAESIILPEPIAPPEPVVVPEPIVAAVPSEPAYQTPPERGFDAVVEEPSKKKSKSKKSQAKPAAQKPPKIHLVPPPEPEPAPEPVPAPARVFKPLKRLPPLATWARNEDLIIPEPVPEPVAPKSEDDVSELFASLRVPAHVLPVTYPHRPYVRRVRAA